MDPVAVAASVSGIIQLCSVSVEILRSYKQFRCASHESKNFSDGVSHLRGVLKVISSNLINPAESVPSDRSEPALLIEALNGEQQSSHDLKSILQDARSFESHIGKDPSTQALPIYPHEKKSSSYLWNTAKHIISMHGKLEFDKERRKVFDDTGLRRMCARRGDLWRPKSVESLAWRFQVVSLLLHLTASSSAIVISSFARNSALIPLGVMQSSSDGSTAAPCSPTNSVGSLMCQIFQLARHPNIAAFVVGCWVFSASTITYQRIHNNERYQAHCTFAALVLASVMGAVLGNDSVLSFFPWAVIIGLSTSTLLESCIPCRHEKFAIVELA